ncbi:MAG: hypothetical protein ACAH80_05170 [Alphaproteobacteria bacterium]
MPDAGKPPAPDVKDKKPDAPPQKPEASQPPVAEVKKPEPEKTAAPAAEPPKAEAPKTETPKTEPAKQEAPAAEAAKTEPPKAEATKPAAEPAKKKNFRFWAEKGVDAAGFGGVWKAWEKGGNRFRNVMKSLGTKAADMIAGRIVSMTFKLIAITFVAGLIGGVSTYGTVLLLSLATGAASGIYSYGKEYLRDRYTGPKEKRELTKFFDKARARSAAISFGSGFAGGAFGLWLAKTEMFQSAMGALKDVFVPGNKKLSIAFNTASAPAVPASLSADFTASAKPAVPVPMMLRGPLPVLK